MDKNINNNSKYKNNKVIVDGIKFDSKMESNIYLMIKERGIKYKIQPKYTIQNKFIYNKRVIREIKYIGDFDIEIGGKIYTIDVKGMETQVFKMKAKMFLYHYGREVIRIKSMKQFREWLKERGIE